MHELRTTSDGVRPNAVRRQNRPRRVPAETNPDHTSRTKIIRPALISKCFFMKARRPSRFGRGWKHSLLTRASPLVETLLFGRTHKGSECIRRANTGVQHRRMCRRPPTVPDSIPENPTGYLTALPFQPRIPPDPNVLRDRHIGRIVGKDGQSPLGSQEPRRKTPDDPVPFSGLFVRITDNANRDADHSSSH